MATRAIVSGFTAAPTEVLDALLTHHRGDAVLNAATLPSAPPAAVVDFADRDAAHAFAAAPLHIAGAVCRVQLLGPTAAAAEPPAEVTVIVEGLAAATEAEAFSALRRHVDVLAVRRCDGGFQAVVTAAGAEALGAALAPGATATVVAPAPEGDSGAPEAQPAAPSAPAFHGGAVPPPLPPPYPAHRPHPHARPPPPPPPPQQPPLRRATPEAAARAAAAVAQREGDGTAGFADAAGNVYLF